MKISEGMLLVIFCISVTPSIVLCNLLFSSTKWNKSLPDELKLKTIIGISLRQCVVECGKRGSCEYIGYMRYLNLCHLYTGLTTPLGLEIGTSLLIRRGDIDSTVFPGDCTCDEREACNAGICGYEECPQILFTNGGVIGNVNDVGGRVKVQCDSGYRETNSHISTTCGEYGNWSYIPSCTFIIVCDDMTISNGNLTGTGNEVGSVRTVVCDTYHEEESGVTSIQCESSGNWSFTPKCSPIVVCVDITIANGDLVGTGYGVGAVRTIVCNQGYEERLGATDIECKSSGTWDYLPVCDIGCPSDTGYTRNGFNIKIYTTVKQKQNGAQNNCALSGGNLVKIDEIWKIDFINEILTSCTEYSKHRDYWTDAKCTSGLYRFTDNTLVPMTEKVFWFKGKPTNYDEGKCVRLKKEGGVYLWDDLDCFDKFRFICEF